MGFLRVNGLSFHIQQLGSPRGHGTVVCLHGLVLDNLSSFYYTLANPLAQEMAVVLYDQRGHGRSARPPSGYRVEDAAGDLADLLERLAPEPPVYLCGNSYGALVALEYALEHPDGVDGLIVIEGHLVVQGWGEQMAETIDLGLWVINQLDAETGGWPLAVADRKLARQSTDARAFVGGTTLVEDLRFARPTDLGALAELDCPTLAIYGQHSDVAHLGRLLASTMPCCELAMLPGASHSVLMERSQRVLAEVRSWLAHRVADQEDVTWRAS